MDGIEFFKGKTLTKTDLDAVQISYGQHYAFDYLSEQVPFADLPKLMQQGGMHWINHALTKGEEGQGHRAETNVKAGFDLIVLDIDENTSVKLAQDLLKDYTYLIYTTKSHTEEQNRFRIILPMDYRLELDTEDYKNFMDSFLEWLPFKSDPTVNQRAKKWETNKNAEIYRNEGKFIDPLPFIPMTSRNENHKLEYKELQSLDNLERWFAQRIATGNRNNEMIKFALALVDSGMTFEEVSQSVKSFNAKMKHPLDDSEIDNTILTTVSKRFSTPTKP